MLPVLAWGIAAVGFVCGVILYPFYGHEVFLLPDTLRPDTIPSQMERVDTLCEVEVRPDSLLPMMKAIQSSLQRQGIQSPPSLGDILEKLSPGLNDKICHPFAIKQRRRERKHKRDRKALEHYDQVKTFDDLLREAIVREGLPLPEEKIENGK